MSKKTTLKRSNHLMKLCAVSLAATLVASMMLTGCSSTTTTSTNTVGTATQQVSTADNTGTDLAAYDLSYTDRDKDPSYDQASATQITLSGSSATVSGSSTGANVNGSTVTISSEGVYVFSGTLTDGQIIVDCPEDAKAKVQLVLNGVTITNSNGPTIYVKQAKKVFVTLAEGSTNTLTDGANYTLDDGSDEPTACIFSKADLTLQGSGTLNVFANYRHAICSKDDLVVTGGTYNLQAAEDALRGRDCVKIWDGTFNLTSGSDAVKSNNDEDDTRGFVCIDGGTFNISAGDDAFHAETALAIRGGNINVTQSYEGLEGLQIFVSGGTTKVVASDDGVNAASGSTSDTPFADAGYTHKFGEDGSATAASASGTTGSTGTSNTTTPLLKVSGGTLEVDAQGDGLDSNGSIEITGGTVIVNGPTSQGDGALDYDATATISGGTVIALGSSGMAEGFTESTQAHALVQASGNAGSVVEIKDANGTVVARTTATKSFATVVVSAPGLTSGSTCTVSVDGTETTFTPSTTAVSNGFGVAGFGGQGPNVQGGRMSNGQPAARG